MTEGLIVDLFAGGGGASLGLAAALGRKVDIAINHDKVALDVHRANHPETLHLESDIWEVKPLDATKGRPVDVLWASPDCTHFSVAKGAVPRKQNIRSLAWVVVRWAREVKPRLIFLENVGEFRSWGPLGKDGRPIKARAGETFRKWTRHLRAEGYEVDYRVLDASEYGAPTRRRRLFLVARCDGQPITWPEPTHGPGRLPFHTAAECVDWSLACPSIFERKKALADKTLWRIAEGIRRFVLESPAPFIVKFQQNSVGQELGRPLDTVMAGAQRFGIVAPALVGVGGRAGQSAPTGGGDPVGTITAKNDRAIVAPSLIKVNHGTDGKTGHREYSLEVPLTAVTAQRRGHALVAPTLIQTGYGEREGQAARVPGLDKPLGTVVAGGRKHALIAPILERQFSQSSGAAIEEPIPTIMPGGGGKTALVSAFLAKHFGDRGQRPGLHPEEPLATITASDHHSLVAGSLVKLRGACNGAAMDEPAPTITASGTHIGEVRAFLTAYYSTDGTKGKGQSLRRPMRAVTSKARLGLVTVAGVDYQIADIGMRMLEPHELLRAQFGTFADRYDLSRARTKAAKVRLIGNSVAPEQALAVVSANRPLAMAT